MEGYLDMTIDINKEYKTVDRKVVTNLQYVPYNSVGEKVTFPIKGTIILRQKPMKTMYTIWTEEGKHSVFGDTKFDLVER